MGEATEALFPASDAPSISIHASRGGSDDFLLKTYPDKSKFQSTLPVGEATLKHVCASFCYIFQSTLPVGEATQLLSISALGSGKISIHASRGGSDVIHAPTTLQITIFQSTLPVGEATDYGQLKGLGQWNFNPRFPWGKRHQFFYSGLFQCIISIHASRGGSDSRCALLWSYTYDFNPRFPWGKRHMIKHS